MDYRFDITCWVTLKTGERHRITSGDTIAGKLLEEGNLASCLQQRYCKEVPVVVVPTPTPTPTPAPAPALIVKAPEVESPTKAAPTTQVTPKAATTPPVGAKKN